MSAAPPNPSVLSQLYLEAVLPCLGELVAHDPAARDLIAGTKASLRFRILSGPAVTLHIEHGTIRTQTGAAGGASIVLLFVSAAHLNAFFSGNSWAVPILLWGGWRIRTLSRFTRLAERLEAVLDGHEAVLASPEGRRLHARLSLMAAGLGLTPLARGDEPTRTALHALPFGLASFTIEGEPQATVWFDYGQQHVASGWSQPPRRPEVSIAFNDPETAYDAMRDQLDALAATGLGRIRVDGLVPLADGLNFIMQRIRVYLQPQDP
jgi:hypothetical protein